MYIDRKGANPAIDSIVDNGHIVVQSRIVDENVHFAKLRSRLIDKCHAVGLFRDVCGHGDGVSAIVFNRVVPQ